MLTLTRKRGEETYLDLPTGERIRIKVTGVSGSRVRLAFDAPADVQISRPEWQSSQARLLDACQFAVDWLLDSMTEQQLAERDILLAELHAGGNLRETAEAALRFYEQMHDAKNPLDQSRRMLRRIAELLREALR